MVRNLCVLGLAIVACGTTGCNRAPAGHTRSDTPVSQAGADRIAVIDLNVVAEEIGARLKISESVKEREREMQADLAGFQAELDRRVDEFRARHPEDLAEHQAELEVLLAENESKMALQSRTLQAQIAAYHSRLKLKLLDDIRPFAWRVASEQGMNIVVANHQVYAVAAERDITRQVIEAINRQNATVSQTGSQPPDEGIRVAEMPGGGDFMPR